MSQENKLAAGAEGEVKPEQTGKEENKAEKTKEPMVSEDAAKKEVEALKAQHQKELEKFKDYDSLRAENEALKKEKLSEQEKAVVEAQDKVRGELEPELEKHKAALQAVLEAELSEIPEEKRDVIPSLELTEKITWLKNAKAKGLFGEPKPSDSTKITPGHTPKAEKPGKVPEPGTPEYKTYLATQYGYREPYSQFKR